MSMIRKAALLAVVALVAVACGSGDDETVRDENGNVIGAGEIGVFSLNVGDCFIDLPVGEVSSVSGVPCADDHRYEIYHLFDVDLPDFDSTAVEEASSDGCLAAFEGYMGVPFETSYYNFSGLQPTVGSWGQGDREVVCLATPFNGEAIAGTAKGAGLLFEEALPETADSTVADGGSQSVFELNIGECYVDTFGSQVQFVEPVSCDEPHGIEVIAMFDVELTEYDATLLGEAAQEGCLAAFEPYMGASYEESWYGLDYLQPSTASWDQGDREVVCVAFPFGDEITQSVGSARGEGRLLES